MVRTDDAAELGEAERNGKALAANMEEGNIAL
jgi:hypothetical protein